MYFFVQKQLFFNAFSFQIQVRSSGLRWSKNYSVDILTIIERTLCENLFSLDVTALCHGPKLEKRSRHAISAIQPIIRVAIMGIHSPQKQTILHTEHRGRNEKTSQHRINPCALVNLTMRKEHLSNDWQTQFHRNYKIR